MLLVTKFVADGNGCFLLETCYPSGRVSENILYFVRLCVSSIKTGTGRVAGQ